MGKRQGGHFVFLGHLDADAMLRLLDEARGARARVLLFSEHWPHAGIARLPCARAAMG